jgi:hypothetical protein
VVAAGIHSCCANDVIGALKNSAQLGTVLISTPQPHRVALSAQ